MLLIPYFWNHETNWSTFGIFLRDGGSSLWLVDDTTTLAAAKKMLKENGFPVESVIKTDGTLYARIQSTINLSDYYLWDEIPLGSEEDVWRTFKIPKALWTCPVFKELFYKETNLPECALVPLRSLDTWV
jgi:hypothetical protein